MSFVNFEWSHALRGFVDTQDKLIVFTLTLIMGAMVIDFLTGTLAAKINPKSHPSRVRGLKSSFCQFARSFSGRTLRGCDRICL